MTHTPAPWAVIDPIEKVSIGGMTHKIYPIAGDEDNPEEGTGVAICILPFEDITPETEAYVQANARLIAAAPDLLNALKRYETWEANLIGCNQAWNTPSGNPQMTNALYEEFIELQQLRNAATRKALG